MTSAILQLQQTLNKIIDEVKHDTLDKFILFLKERLHFDKDRLNELVIEFKASHPTNIINFGPRKKERKTRPPNSYNMFIKEKMQEIKQQHPEYKGKELMRKATEAWNLQKASRNNDNNADE